MAISNYGELKSAIANWLDDSNLTSRIPEYISLAEDRIHNGDGEGAAYIPGLRVRDQEATTSLTISSEDTALPSDFLEARRLYLDQSPKKELRYVTPWHMSHIWASSQTGEPDVYTTEGTNLRVGPIPDSTYTGDLLYWKRFAALSSDGDTNWILSNARGLYLYGALLEAGMALENPEVNIWHRQFRAALNAANQNDKLGRFTGSPLIARTDVMGG